MAPGDDGMEGVEQLEERLAPLDHALVMEGHVDLGLFVTHPDQALLELLETAEDVAVVGPKAGEVDVGEEEHTLGDPQPAMACSVAGQMHRLDRYATEIPHGAVGVALGIGRGS